MSSKHKVFRSAYNPGIRIQHPEFMSREQCYTGPGKGDKRLTVQSDSVQLP